MIRAFAIAALHMRHTRRIGAALLAPRCALRAMRVIDICLRIMSRTWRYEERARRLRHFDMSDARRRYLMPSCRARWMISLICLRR